MCFFIYKSIYRNLLSSNILNINDENKGCKLSFEENLFKKNFKTEKQKVASQNDFAILFNQTSIHTCVN